MAQVSLGGGSVHLQIRGSLNEGLLLSQRIRSATPNLAPKFANLPWSLNKLAIKLSKSYHRDLSREAFSKQGGSIDMDGSEPTEERIARLVADNEKLLARITELETVLMEVKAGNSDRRPNVTSALPVHRQLEMELGSQTIKKATHDKSEKFQASQKLANIIWPSPADAVPFWKQRKKSIVHDLTSNIQEGEVSNTELDRDSVYIVHVTAEMAPLAKVGGLGDVVTGLARACLDRGHKVVVMLPFYGCIDGNQIEDLVEAESFNSFHRGSWIPVKTFHGKVLGVPVLFVQPSNHFFKGKQIYGGSYNELEAYVFFSRACLERMQVTGDHPDIIHLHEWHTGVLPLLYWDIYYSLSLKKPRIVLTIHNMEHYGECRVEQINVCGLDGSQYQTLDRAVDERTIGHNPERLSLLKGGIVYSNAVTTVSPTYKNETLCSGWLASTLMRHRKKYAGILNGIDTVLWNPASDSYLVMQYDAKDLLGKQICKQYLQKGLGLKPDELFTDGNHEHVGHGSPLVICITRLVAQKGIHLIRHAIFRISELGGQFVLLGTAPDPHLQAEFEQLAHQFKDSKNVRLLLTYSEELAHMMYAAGDIILVPSMFEPCGLTQMIGMRYGAIPVVRRTGGLADTVFDVDDPANSHKANGFLFDGITEGSLNYALDRALAYYLNRFEWWRDLASRVMKLDNSWNKSAKEYVALYNSLRATVSN